MAHPASTPPLRAQFLALEEERARTWAPDALALNVNQRATLVKDHASTHNVVKVGDTIKDFTLPTVTGGQIDLKSLVAHGPAVLVFFRFAGCPACNITLPHYSKTLWPELKAAHIPVLALSPQPVALLSDIATRHTLPFPVASDTGLAVARSLGITYTFDEPSQQAALAKGAKSEGLNGLADTWELPKPTVLVVGPDQKVLFADVSPDWMNRTESADVLKALNLQSRKDAHAA